MSDQPPNMMLKSIQRNGLLLALFALVCTALLAAINIVTQPLIAEQQQLQQQKVLGELLDDTQFDNRPALNCIKVNSPLIGENQTIYRAMLADVPYAAVIEARAPDGYSGNIDLLVAVENSGQLLGVRTLAHRETPGLGDRIELTKSDWILGFNNKRLSADNLSQWAVKKDGGHFDAFTGATITPRAVVKAVKQSLEYFAENKNALFSLPNQCETQL